ncbi:hypothetical protein [Microbispora sp. GKU 823]|uniref:hypothetical protein n=1 Tax=Microbispora sp. GKU 823 TaxID=1652100 RepID=UPI0009A2BD46|nr:hypothetical protein [Microbispora sp. GKU 823]OPG13691.1 hypothetical protein B1L11_06810 [Microbispora sp. GKU 823]
MTEPMADERLAEIQAALSAVPAPPWHWIGDTKHQGPMLATKHSGWIYVMGFKRLGMRGAQPAFPVKGPDGYLLITPCREIEDRAVAAKDVAVPRAPYDPDTVRGIDNPVAKWLEHSAQYAAELLAEVERLRAKLDAPCGSCHPCTNYADETWRAAGRTPPHVAEWDALRAERANAVATVAEQAQRLFAREREHNADRAELARVRAMLDDARARCNEAEAKLHQVAMTKVWTNEDGKRFVFVDDLAAALGLPGEPAPADEPTPEQVRLRTALREAGEAMYGGCDCPRPCSCQADAATLTAALAEEAGDLDG